MDAPKIFTPEYYARMRDLESASWWNAGMRDVAATVLQLAKLPASGVMLDVGCGSGQTMMWFRRMRPAWQTVGLDLASEGLVAARSLGETSVMRASALHLPLPSASVDLVITLDVLQHLPLDGGDRQALNEVARVLKPGGYVFVRTNAQSFPHTADDPQFEFRKYEQPHLRQRLEEAGFDVLRLSRINALLGLAEIPRELKARHQPNSYHGILSQPRLEPAWRSTLKRRWLAFEGRALRMGVRWPIGRSFVALCQRRSLQ